MNNTFTNRLSKKCFYTVILIASFFLTSSLKAQTTLVAGDIEFTGYNSNNSGTASNLFSFVIIRPGGISAGTEINFTDRGWNGITNNLGIASAGEGIITWTASTDLAQFTEVTLKTASLGNSMEIISTGTASVAATFVLSSAGDQILAYQINGGVNTFIAAIQMNIEAASGTSMKSDSVHWDYLVASGGTPYSVNRSSIPPGLNVNSAIFCVQYPTDAERDNAKYNCNFDTAGSISELQYYICRPIHWFLQDVTAYTTPAACPFRLITTTITLQPADSTTCNGAAASFEITASNATGYQWQVSTGGTFTNLSAIAPYSGTTTSTLTISAVTESMNNYKYRCVATGIFSPKATSNPATLFISPAQWTGDQSSSWSDPANWSCNRAPTALTNIIIVPGGTFMPVVDVTTAVCNNIIIAAGSSLTISAGNKLDIKGTFTNNGTFTPDGTVLFSGTVQTIPAASYENLEIAGSGNKTLAGSVTINGTLTLTNGTVQLDNYDLIIGNTGNLTGGTASSFIITNGTGALIQNNIGSGGRATFVFFPIGASSSSFTQAGLVNTGAADQFSARVVNGVSTAYSNDVATGSALTGFNVNKTWFISETIPGGSNAVVTFQWYNGDEQAGFDRLNAFVGHYTGGHWTRGPENLASSGSNPYSLSLSGVTSFSPFSVGSTGSILPVHLISFKGKKTQNGVWLEWVTDNEQQLTGYSIEKSEDGQIYQAIGNTVAAGTPGIHNYTFTDAVALNKIIYYRLKQMDADGRYTYSPVIALSDYNDRQFALVYPNPTNSQATLLVKNDQEININFSIINNTGTLLRKWQRTLTAGDAYETINLSGLAAGIYYLELKGINYHQKIKIIKR